MTDHYPYKFNVTTLEYDRVAEYLHTISPDRYTIARREMVGELTIDEWREIKRITIEREARECGDDHRITDLNERNALLSTDSDERVAVTVLGLPTSISRRLLNRVAIQVGVANAGIARENYAAELARGVETFLIQFKSSDDAILFKLAMWKPPGEDARP